MKVAPEKKRNLFERQRVVAVQGAAFTMHPFFSGIGTGCHRNTAAVALFGQDSNLHNLSVKLFDFFFYYINGLIHLFEM